ncbi:MAG TPA: alpha/beta fold hydrolase [Caulobacteraceae bacterium]|jgi:pimeloyl-ACP methyl ester carboxylesterase|nr:alpha/beta fold hydrolase [Caulobacteraceae bacterium]
MEKPPLRGELVDIGGRNIRILCKGRKSDAPLILFEAGMFGGAASWDAVQTRLAAIGLRSCAYDRAGIGYSDPGPFPRDATAINADFEAMLKAKGETGPYILVAHSLGGLEMRMFAERHPHEVRGMVMIDTTSPELASTKAGRLFLDSYKPFAASAEVLSQTAILSTLTRWLGDQEGLSGEAHDEVIYFFSKRHDQQYAIAEVAAVPLRAKEALAAGPLDPDIPVTSVVLDGEQDYTAEWGVMRNVEARKSRYGAQIDIKTGTHPELIGPLHADDVVRAIQSVIYADERRREGLPH